MTTNTRIGAGFRMSTEAEPFEKPMSEREGRAANLLLLSNSWNTGEPYMAHAQIWVVDCLRDARSILIVDYAVPPKAPSTNLAVEFFQGLGVKTVVASEHDSPGELAADADVVFVCGGNTFRLLRNVTDLGLLPIIRRRVEQGTPYISASAGTNLACPTIMTTNDMPIVAVSSFDALGLTRWQINTHYSSSESSHAHGSTETRAERLEEFLIENPHSRVLALPDGTALRVTQGREEVFGEGGAVIFSGQDRCRQVPAGDITDQFVTGHTTQR